MALYDFECKKCNAIITMQFGMNDDEGRENAKCPECKSKVKRHWSGKGLPSLNVKTPFDQSKLLPSQKFVDVDGRPVVMNFIDHGPDSGLAEDSVASSIQGARMDEETGRPVVDIVSNVPDPLGKIEEGKQRSMEQGLTETEVKNVNQKYKTR